MSDDAQPLCEICLFRSETDPFYFVRRGEHIVVIPADADHDWAGMACCDEHYRLHLRVLHGQPLSGLSGGVQ